MNRPLTTPRNWAAMTRNMAGSEWLFLGARRHHHGDDELLAVLGLVAGADGEILATACGIGNLAQRWGPDGQGYPIVLGILFAQLYLNALLLHECERCFLADF